jgi:hypothetical protein
MFGPNSRTAVMVLALFARFSAGSRMIVPRLNSDGQSQRGQGANLKVPGGEFNFLDYSLRRLFGEDRKNLSRLSAIEEEDRADSSSLNVASYRADAQRYPQAIDTTIVFARRGPSLFHVRRRLCLRRRYFLAQSQH